ncbi:helix-turn-helix domain-containing protein [Methylobacterium sp. R2-1]|uniref:helix-turn-helix domain-containing protein n=1 Tax=Methylobacterium sp. R2-1 TaxID=2587064 RepID=UPI0017A96148|nr:helix-turn-helix domain-containing protein [Methylobacterium sp. R2-1]MBB2965201.1 hypothetical protein [Methylobacterium sp. R2-1]
MLIPPPVHGRDRGGGQHLPTEPEDLPASLAVLASSILRVAEALARLPGAVLRTSGDTTDLAVRLRLGEWRKAFEKPAHLRRQARIRPCPCGGSESAFQSVVHLSGPFCRRGGGETVLGDPLAHELFVACVRALLYEPEDIARVMRVFVRKGDERAGEGMQLDRLALGRGIISRADALEAVAVVLPALGVGAAPSITATIAIVALVAPVETDAHALSAVVCIVRVTSLNPDIGADASLGRAVPRSAAVFLMEMIPRHPGTLLCGGYLKLQAMGLAENYRCRLPIAQLDLGDALGLTPVHVNRVLQEMRGRALITLHAHTLVIEAWDELVRNAQFDPTYLNLER